MKEESPTRSICRFLSILKVINRIGPVSLLTISKEIDIPYPTVSRIIQTLLESGLIERVDKTKCYRATGKTLSLSNGFADRDRLAMAARGQMEALTARIGWPLALVTRVGASMVVRDSTHHLTSLALSRCPAGFKFPVLESAAGHVFLSYASDEERECVLRGLAMAGGRSAIMSLFESGAPMARIRAGGYATYERGQRELDPGKISSIAVPILEDDRLAGVLTVMLFASAMPMSEALRRYLDALQGTAAEISKNLSSGLGFGDTAAEAEAIARARDRGPVALSDAAFAKRMPFNNGYPQQDRRAVPSTSSAEAALMLQ